MAHADPFSTSTMLNALDHLPFAGANEPVIVEYPAVAPPYPRGISSVIPPPGFPPSPSPPSPQELEKRLRVLFGLMTNSEDQDAAPFKHTISRLDKRELQMMASMLTSDSDYFLTIARNENGSKRIQKLLGRANEVDTILVAAILPRFLDIITDKYASFVARRGMRVFDMEKKEAMYEGILHYALRIACDRYGNLALTHIITDTDDPCFRNKIFDIVAHNALLLSNDAYGSYVIQRVLKLNDLRCKKNIVVNLRGHCVDLSFQRSGSYIVQRLLETEESMVVVVEELLKCQVHKLIRLARNEYGRFVVDKALRVTQKEMIRTDLFWGLVNKLKPFLHLLPKSSGIASVTPVNRFWLRCVDRHH